MNINREKKLVTVGIPSYNRPLTLSRALESVINQSYENLEIIVSDDSSPNAEVDDTIKDYCSRDSRIIYIRHKKNIGPRENHSFLVEKASGEYFMWLADDDYISKDYIEEIMKVFIKDDSYSLIGGQTFFINGSDLPIKKSPYNLLERNPKKRILKYLDIIHHNSIYYGVFRTHNSVDYDIHCFGSDWLHVVRLAYKGKVKTLKNISIFREAEGGASTRNFSYFERIKIYYDVYRNINYDLFHSNLYNELTLAELNMLSKEIRKRFLKYLYIDGFFNKIKNKFIKTLKN
ncbi:glycosyltransferase family 2 protein [Sulfurimonas gotlandica]|nr:glycosyltransferase family 2 protein [Sulfurimonas gotlandica]